MKFRVILSTMSVVLGVILQVVALATYLLFWRADNEPGYTGDPWMLAAALCLGGLGVFLFFGGNLGLIVNRAKTAAVVAWLLVVMVLSTACYLSPMILILLV